jgi:hypothetical protein
LLPRITACIPSALVTASGTNELLPALQATLLTLFALSSSNQILALSRLGLSETKLKIAERDMNRASKTLQFRLFSLLSGTLSGLRSPEPADATAIKKEEWRRLWTAALMFDRAVCVDMMTGPRIPIPVGLRVPCRENQEGWMLDDQSTLFGDVLRNVDDADGDSVAGLSHLARLLLLFDLCAECAQPVKPPPQPLLSRIVFLQSLEPSNSSTILLRAALMLLLLPRPSIQSSIGLLARPRLPDEPVVSDSVVIAGEHAGLSETATWTLSDSFATACAVSDGLEALVDADSGGWPGAGIMASLRMVLGMLGLMKVRMVGRGILAHRHGMMESVERAIGSLGREGKTEARDLLCGVARRVVAECGAWEWGINGAGRFGVPGYGRGLEEAIGRGVEWVDEEDWKDKEPLTV